MERNTAKDSPVCSSSKMTLPPTVREDLSDKPRAVLLLQHIHKLAHIHT